jgi:4-oxalocrotonate tautomerase
MPIVEITLIEGRTQAQKEKLAAKVTEAVMESVNVSPEAVRVILREVPAYHFAVGGVFKGKPEPQSSR